jgi:hypothetical protein
MLCCVIGGALVALLLSKLSSLPVIGRWIGRLESNRPDPSNWRLDSAGVQ